MKKKILKFCIIFLSIFFIVIIYEIVDFSNKIINREVLTLDINNARNPQVKKFLRYVDNFYASLLINFNKKAKSHFINFDNRDKLPDEILINKTNKFSENLYPKKNNGKDRKSVV